VEAMQAGRECWRADTEREGEERRSRWGGKKNKGDKEKREEKKSIMDI
jgi:hypothetical protein